MPFSGAATEAASYLDIPLLNAGDGAGEHPTQVELAIAFVEIWHNFNEGIIIITIE